MKRETQVKAGFDEEWGPTFTGFGYSFSSASPGKLRAGSWLLDGLMGDHDLPDSGIRPRKMDQRLCPDSIIINKMKDSLLIEEKEGAAGLSSEFIPNRKQWMWGSTFQSSGLEISLHGTLLSLLELFSLFHQTHMPPSPPQRHFPFP